MRFTGNKGFSLVELIMTIVIIGILAVVALPRFFSTANFDQRGFQDELLSAVRYAQRLSIATQCPVQVNINAVANRYDMYFPNNTNPSTCATAPGGYGANPVQHPGGGNFARAAPSGVTITDGLVVSFNSLGQPSTGESATVNGLNIIIEAETGYVHD